MLIVLDTLRADHLHVYGYPHQTSPVLDQFAKENLFFRYAVTAAPWTPPSVATMITGLYPSEHGMMPPNDRKIAKKIFPKLSDNFETLAEVFKKRGYQTTGISPNPWITKEFGYDQGYDQFHFRERAPAAEITKAAKNVISGFGENPFFLYLHYLDPHDPYSPPEKYREMFPLPSEDSGYSEKMRSFIRLYDGEIKYLDDQLGELFSFLKEKRLYDDLIIVIVADHGEQFMEHGNHRHGYQLFNEEVHVPLMIKGGTGSKTINDTVGTIDVYPTILDAAGVPIPSGLQGLSLLRDEEVARRSGVLSEITRHYNEKSITTPHGQKLIMDYGMPPGSKPPSLLGIFDRHKDYLERVPLTGIENAPALRSDFDSLVTSLEKRSKNELHSETEIENQTIEQLKSLGYLQ